MTTPTRENEMEDKELREFLAQFDQAREDFKNWPKWMREASRVASAHFPRTTPTIRSPEALSNSTGDK